MITAINETTGVAQSVRASATGRVLAEVSPKFSDLGCVISGASGQPGYQVPVNGVVNANMSHTGLGWVRIVLVGLQSSGTFDVGYQRNMNGFNNYVSLVSSLVGIASPGISTKAVAPDDTGGRSIIGDSCRFYLKNVGAAVADASLYVQVMA